VSDLEGSVWVCRVSLRLCDRGVTSAKIRGSSYVLEGCRAIPARNRLTCAEHRFTVNSVLKHCAGRVWRSHKKRKLLPRSAEKGEKEKRSLEPLSCQKEKTSRPLGGKKRPQPYREGGRKKGVPHTSEGSGLLSSPKEEEVT